MKKYLFVYKTTNLVNGKIYVGKHICKNLEDGYLGSGIIITAAIKKYGKDNFKREIIEHVQTKPELSERETFWIKELRSQDLTIGYNITNGGDGFSSWTTEQHIKAAKKRVGQKRSEETREKQSKARVGMKFSDEHKKNLSKARQKRVITEETRKKCSKTSRGKINIKVFIVEDSDGNQYETINGLTDFCRIHNLNLSHMHHTIKNSKKHKGWRIIKCIS